jgi:hypothetical protein
MRSRQQRRHDARIWSLRLNGLIIPASARHITFQRTRGGHSSSVHLDQPGPKQERGRVMKVSAASTIVADATPRGRREALGDDQREFLAERNASESGSRCLVRAYRTRIAQLNVRLAAAPRHTRY